MSSHANPLDDRRNAPARRQAVLNVIAGAKEPITRRQIHERLWRQCTRKQIEGVARDLLAAGLIECVVEATGGHSEATFRAVRPAEAEVG